MSITANPNRWTTMRIAAVMAASCSGLLVNVLPAVTGVLAKELGFQPSMLGAFASANSLGGLVGGIAAIVVMRHHSPRTTVTIGLTISLVTNLISIVSGFAPYLIVLSALAGFGSGFTISASVYVFGLIDRERNNGAYILGQTVFATLGMLAVPAIVAAFGWRAVFATLGLILIPPLLLARHFPKDYRGEVSSATAAAAASRGTMWLGLVSAAFCSLATLVTWTYLERIGAEAGIAADVITHGLTVCTIGGFVSSVLVLVLGGRVRGTKPLVVCTLLNVGGMVAMDSPNPWVYVAAISAFYFSLPIYLSAQFGVIMQRAASKRFAAQYQLASRLGALGPAIGGVVAQQYGFAAIRWLGIVLMLAASALLWVGFLGRPAEPTGSPTSSPMESGENRGLTPRLP
jgi:predicted MFS family arabinose efflux permease